MSLNITFHCLQGDNIQGSVNGKIVFKLEMRTSSQNGFVGYGADSFGYVAFNNFMVEDSSLIYWTIKVIANVD